MKFSITPAVLSQLLLVVSLSSFNINNENNPNMLTVVDAFVINQRIVSTATKATTTTIGNHHHPSTPSSSIIMQMAAESSDDSKSDSKSSSVATATSKTKEIGLLTFDLDDTLYPIAPIVEDANGKYLK